MLKPMVQHSVRAVIAGELNAQEMANMAYGAARSVWNKWLSMLFAALARAAEQRMAGFTTQALANTAWALATAR